MHRVARWQLRSHLPSRCHCRLASVLIGAPLLRRGFAQEISRADASRDVIEHRRRNNISPLRRKVPLPKFTPDKSKYPTELPQDTLQHHTNTESKSTESFDTTTIAVTQTNEHDVDEDADDDDVDDVEVDKKDPDMSAFADIQYPRSRSGKFHSNIFFIRETRNGPQMIPYPMYDQDEMQDNQQNTTQDHAADNNNIKRSSPSSSLPPPLLPRRSPKSIIGQAIGGEKLSYADLSRINERDLAEHYSKGGGRGGQKVNKTNNCVHLLHLPTGTSVKCHATRSLEDNRRIAREILRKRLDELCNGPNSANGKREQKIRKSKSKSRRRAQAKYGANQQKTVDVDDDEHNLQLITPYRADR